MPTWREDIISVLESSSGSAPLLNIYSMVKNRRGMVPNSYKEMIRRTIETASSDSKVWDKKNDLFYSVEGIGGGIWGLRSSQNETPVATDINVPELTGGSASPGKALFQVSRIIRDSKLCRDVKKLYGYKCQLCNLTINLPSGENYAEAHHIIPLGAPHGGPDQAENIIVLCPNHHAMLDYGVLKLEIANISANKNHIISPKSIRYHNSHIYKERQVPA